MKNVLITGGSSGIGLEISKRFAKHDFTIFWVSLLDQEVQDALQEMSREYPSTKVEYLIQDLSKVEGAQKVKEWVSAKNIIIDVLVNNAGFATYGMSKDISMEKEINMLNLNIMSVFKLTRIFMVEMISKDKGTIINISSSTSLRPVPRMAAYAASKAFVAHYSQGLQEELSELKSNVKVITICPAAIKDTKFKTSAGMATVKTFEGLQATTKTEVADDVWKAYSTSRTYLLSGAKLRKTNWLMKVLPKSVILKLMKEELSRA